MTGAAPRVSVVVATHNRADQLERLLRSLREQTLEASDFEVVVVDDASADGTPSLLDAAAGNGGPDLRAFRRDVSGGPAVARNQGWRAARAPLVAFTDDDCVASPEWLEAALRVCPDGSRVVQGSTRPDPERIHERNFFTRTQDIDGASPLYETCNIFYPRALLEQLGGFDESFPLPGGEDTDLGWRAKGSGAEIVYEPEARVFHAIDNVGLRGILRHARRWEDTVPLFAKHPELRREQLHHGVFWSPVHEDLLRFLVAVALLRRMPTVALLLARPYLVRLFARRSLGLLAPLILALDLTELHAIVRGAIRHRVLVI